jgi:prolyl-tRNA synthetase
MMQNGWALQSGTSHFLGQNFAKAFDVYYQTADKSGENTRELVWATSWGVSTRLLGAMIMTHSDDRGLILPPKVAPIQVVIVPIGTQQNETLINRIDALKLALEDRSVNIRVHIDDRQHIRPGQKYFEWERKGVPLRIEVGPRDIEQGILTISNRISEDKKKQVIEYKAAEDAPIVAKIINEELDKIHTALFNSAIQRLELRTFRPNSYDEMKAMLSTEDNSQVGFYLVPWKCNAENEGKIKEDCKATIRCYPKKYNESPPPNGIKCFYTNDQATHMAIFARAF